MNFNPTLHKLSNGVTVILDPMEAATTYAIVAFKTGSRDEAPSEHGLTHFCEHMLCKGTKRFPTAQNIRDYISDNAGYFGASTGHERTQLYGGILAENTDKLLDVFSDMLQNSVIDSDVMERERSVITDELRRNLDNQDQRSAEFLVRHIIQGDFSVFRTLGTFENIAAFTRKQIKMFMVRRFTGKNCIICVSGKIENPEKLLASIDQKFGGLSSMDVNMKRQLAQYRPAVAHETLQDRKNVDVCILTPQLYDLDAKNDFERQCIVRFNDYLNTELFRVLRSENGLVYGVEPDIFSADGVLLNGFSAKTAPENVARMVALMAQVARDVCTTNPITDTFLQRYHNRTRLGDALFLESAEKRCKCLVDRYEKYGDLYDHDARLRMVAKITAADVIKSAQGYFDKPVSIISSGKPFDADLLQIWHDNFGASQSVQNMMIKDKGCR